MCAVIGPHGHLMWFKASLPGFSNEAKSYWYNLLYIWYFVGFIGTPLTHTVARPLALITGLNWLFSALIYPTGDEAFSFWCLTGITQSLQVLYLTSGYRRKMASVNPTSEHELLV